MRRIRGGYSAGDSGRLQRGWSNTSQLGAEAQHFFAEMIANGLDGMEGLHVIGPFGEAREVGIGTLMTLEFVALGAEAVDERQRLGGPLELWRHELVDALEKRQREDADHTELGLDRGEIGELHRFGDAADLVAEPGEIGDVPGMRDAPEKPGHGDVLDGFAVSDELVEVVNVDFGAEVAVGSGAGLAAGIHLPAAARDWFGCFHAMMLAQGDGHPLS